MYRKHVREMRNFRKKIFSKLSKEAKTKLFTGDLRGLQSFSDLINFFPQLFKSVLSQVCVWVPYSLLVSLNVLTACGNFWVTRPNCWSRAWGGSLRGFPRAGIPCSLPVAGRGMPSKLHPPKAWPLQTPTLQWCRQGHCKGCGGS